MRCSRQRSWTCRSSEMCAPSLTDWQAGYSPTSSLPLTSIIRPDPLRRLRSAEELARKAAAAESEAVRKLAEHSDKIDSLQSSLQEAIDRLTSSQGQVPLLICLLHPTTHAIETGQLVLDYQHMSYPRCKSRRHPRCYKSFIQSAVTLILAPESQL